MTGLKPVSFKKPVMPEPRLSVPYVPGRHSSRFWSDAEKEIVRKYYPEGGAAACLARLPGRGRSGVYQQARLLGLRAAKVNAGARNKITVPPDFDDRLRTEWARLDGKKRGEVSALADRLGVPRWWLTKRATKLGLTVAHRKEPDWTKAEIDLLRKVPLHNVERCAAIFREHGFRRSPTSIMVKSKREGLSRRYRETLSAGAAAKILGIDSKAVTGWCIAGELEATRRKSRRLPQQGGAPWSITRAALRRFIVDHVERIDLRKVDKVPFIELLAGEVAP